MYINEENNFHSPFMESYDFKGKTVIPFATSSGSTIDKACKDLQASYPQVQFKPGKLLNRTTKKDLESFCGK